MLSRLAGLSGTTLCGCRHCEEANAVIWDRQRDAYRVGLAVGLRLARAMAGAEPQTTARPVTLPTAPGGHLCDQTKASTPEATTPAAT